MKTYISADDKGLADKQAIPTENAYRMLGSQSRTTSLLTHRHLWAATSCQGTNGFAMARLFLLFFFARKYTLPREKSVSTEGITDQKQRPREHSQP